MAALQLPLDIPGDNVADTKGALLTVWPNEDTKDDPSWADPKDGTKAPQVAKYTDKQWLIYKVQLWLNKVYKNGKQMQRDKGAVVIKDIFTTGE